jgi:hypothetical protein
VAGTLAGREESAPRGFNQASAESDHPSTLGFRPIAQFEAPERKREARDIAKRALESLRSEDLLIPFLGLNTPPVGMLD